MIEDVHAFDRQPDGCPTCGARECSLGPEEHQSSYWPPIGRL